VIAFFRRDRSPARQAAIALLVLGWLCPLVLPHAADDDRLCLAAAMGSTGEGSRVGVAVSPQQPDHCAICHTARSLRTASLTDVGRANVLVPQRLVDAPIDVLLHTPAHDRLPARAPPAL
jgi:hypothetical protein